MTNYMNKTDLKLYAITDRQWLHGARLSEHVKLAIEGGATMIQIRDKDILSKDCLLYTSDAADE